MLYYFSGDGDFRRLLEAVQRRGLRATVISSNRTKPSMIADELRRQADQYVDLENMRGLFGKPASNKSGHEPMDTAYDEQLETPMV